MNRKHWTKEEELQLEKSISEKESPKNIAYLLNKSRLAILGKAQKMGLSFRHHFSNNTRFGKLTILRKSKKKKTSRGSCYLCLCDCGNRVVVSRTCLRTGNQISCGCVKKNNRFRFEGSTAYNKLYTVCRANAKGNGRDFRFELSRDEHKQIITQCCHYCGAEPSPYNPYLRKDGSRQKSEHSLSQETIDRAWIRANTVDRVDSDIGYVLSNCVPACWPCNYTKMDQKYDQFITHAYKIVEFQEKKKLK